MFDTKFIHPSPCTTARNGEFDSGSTKALESTRPLTGVKGGRCVQSTTLPTSCADCLEIGRVSALWILQDCPSP